MWLEIHGLNLRNHKKMEKIQQNMTEGAIREKNPHICTTTYFSVFAKLDTCTW